MDRYRSGHNELDSKSSDGQPSVGSNPTLSAKCSKHYRYRWPKASDINLFSGIKLAHRIKEINPHAKIILATVAYAFEYAYDLIQLRIDGFITKPYQPENLKREFDRIYSEAGR